MIGMLMSQFLELILQIQCLPVIELSQVRFLSD